MKLESLLIWFTQAMAPELALWHTPHCSRSPTGSPFNPHRTWELQQGSYLIKLYSNVH